MISVGYRSLSLFVSLLLHSANCYYRRPPTPVLTKADDAHTKPISFVLIVVPQTVPRLSDRDGNLSLCWSEMTVILFSVIVMLRWIQHGTRGPVIKRNEIQGLRRWKTLIIRGTADRMRYDTTSECDLESSTTPIRRF